MKKPKEALLFRFSVLLDTEGKIVIEERNGIDYIERYVNPKDPALYIRELDKRCKEKIEMFKKEKI